MSPPTIYLGCISGTSVDGLDIAAVDLRDGQIHWIAAQTHPLPDPLRQSLLRLANPSAGELDRYGECDVALGRFIADAVKTFLADHQIDPGTVRAVGSHGQTVRHRPHADGQANAGFTLQIGDPNQIAEHTGLTTVADFRRRDMAAGGQGAPLVPPFHQALFGDRVPDGVVLNIGGISNITILGDDLRGFDTGPGNGLMDSWYGRFHAGAYDADGTWGRTGQVNERLLKAFLNDPYFSAPPPKSTGREYFNAAWLQAQVQAQMQADLAAEHVQATLCELTARCNRDAIDQWASQASQVIVCGGGRHNSALMERLQNNLKVPVSAAEDWHVDGDAVEAAAFAWLAYCALEHRSGNAPRVTGSAGDRVLGAVYPGSLNPA